MSRERVGFGLNDDEQIDIEDLTGGTEQPQQDQEKLKKALDKAGEETGFVSREAPKKKMRKRTPYVIQKNMKMRIDMPELLADLTKRIQSSSDQETIEIALGVLIVQEGVKGLINRFEKITKDS
jgi:phosphoenolpyruvate-protein kinase (PTS system EI component)